MLLKSLCVASVNLMFLVLGLFFSVYIEMLSALNVFWGLLFALCYHSSVRGRICSPVFGVDTPRSVSELWYEVDGTGVLLLGGEVVSIPPQKLSSGNCALWYHLSLSVWAIKYTISGTGLGPASSVGMPAIDTVFLRFCCHKATSTDLSQCSGI